MKNYNDLVPVVNTLADALNDGLTIGFQTVDGMQQVVVTDAAGGIELSATVGLPRVYHPKDYRFVYGATAVNAPQGAKPVKTIGAKKKSAKWWSRFNFEKNIMKMTLLALQDRYPAEGSFPQSTFAQRLAHMMSWEISTARKHITQAAKMGIITRAVIGTVYHITGINDVDLKTAQEEIADREQPPARMPLPGDHFPEDETPAPMSALAHEGRIQFEQEFEKAVDETVLP